MKQKICFVIHRYGQEVNGGAELHCFQLISHLKKYYEIEVITTKAIDYFSWKNEYVNDMDYVDGVKVFRYPVEYERNMEEFKQYISHFMTTIKGNEDEEMHFINRQGPYSPELISATKEKENEYDLFVFYTYLYYPTIKGIDIIKRKAIFIPTAHDEPYLYMDIFKKNI